MKGSEFVFDYVHLMYHKCHKVNPNHGGSYIDSPDQMKNRKATINPINKCFQYVLIAVLSREEIKKDLQIITKIKLFINKYNWEEINFSSEKDDWKKFEKKYVIIALNVLYAKKEKKMYPTYVSKRNPNREKQVILLMIPNGEKREPSKTLAS